MTLFHPGCLAVFHSKAALVKGISGDKLEIALEGGTCRNVREKDLEWLHPGPAEALPHDRLPDPDFEEIA